MQVPYAAFGREDEVDDFSSSRSRLRDVQDDVDEVCVCVCTSITHTDS